jgi:hypothetical protein
MKTIFYGLENKQKRVSGCEAENSLIDSLLFGIIFVYVLYLTLVFIYAARNQNAIGNANILFFPD